MVYCGRPSRGCQTCKSRHIKCDEVVPSCSQCVRSGWECPGYTDVLDLMFRDETSAIKRRIQRDESSRRAGRGGGTSTPRSGTSRVGKQVDGDDSATEVTVASTSSTPLASIATSTSTSTPALTSTSVTSTASTSTPAQPAEYVDQDFRLSRLMQPQTNFQEVATAFFFEHFIVPNIAHSPECFLDNLVAAYASSDRQSALDHACRAVAMCSLANYPAGRTLGSDARKSYGRALVAVRRAMADPVLVKADETLISVILLALYEEVSCEHTTTTAWESHIDGAVALIRIRGPEIIKSRRSKSIFDFVRNLVIMFSLQHDRSADDFPSFGPATVHQQEDEAGEQKEDDANDSTGSDDRPPGSLSNRPPTAALGLISISLPGLRLDATRLISQPRTKANAVKLVEIIKAAMIVDTNLDEWVRLLPQDWHPRTAFIQPAMDETTKPLSQPAWTGPAHVYKNTLQSYYWNAYRVNRLVTHTIIRNCAVAAADAQLTGPIGYTIKYSQYMVDQMVQHICASVMYNLDTTLQTVQPANPDAEVCARASGAYFVMWPLDSLLRFGAITDDRQRIWVVGRLLVLSEMYGLRRARKLLLKATEGLESAGWPFTIPPALPSCLSSPSSPTGERLDSENSSSQAALAPSVPPTMPFPADP